MNNNKNNNELETEMETAEIPGEIPEDQVEIVISEGSGENKSDETAALKDQLLRQMAEYDNFRKRTAKERAEQIPEIKAGVIAEFLPVLDNLERALGFECSDAEYKKGVELVRDSFLSLLAKAGVNEVETVTFDPKYHNAVSQVSDDTKQSGEISAVFQKGYKLGEKVLRFAMVAVAK